MSKYLLILALLSFVLKPLKAQDQASKKQVFFEKVYLATDREIYVAGEDLWYSAFLVNGQDNRLIGTSSTLYVELTPVTEDDEPQKQIIQLKEGKGQGDFELAENIKPGNYVLRAWTNWMRNFGDNFIFQKEIKILADPTQKANDGKKNAATAVKTSKENKSKSTSSPVQALIQFLPEGGSLINSVSSVVAFKAVDGSGRSLALGGEIVNNKGESITSIESKDGSGIFLLTPVAGESYRAKGKFGNGKTFDQALPAALARGYSIRITEKDSLYQVIVSTNQESALLGKDVLLAGKSQGLVRFKTQFTMQNLQQVVSVYKSNFPEGIAAITLYDHEGRPNCERLVYVDKKARPLVNILKDKTSYQPAEEIKVTIKVSDEHNNPLKATLAVAAVDAALAKAGKSTIASYLLLESELKGKIENPKQYFDPNDLNRSRKLDLLMLTQGWRDFLWKRLADEGLNITQIPESGITISGSVKRKLGDKPIALSNVTVRSVGNNQSQLFSGTTNNQGRFYLDGFKFFGAQKFSANAIGSKGEKEGWIALDPVFKSASFKTVPVPDTTGQNTLQNYREIADRYLTMKRRQSLSGNNMLDEVQITQKRRIIIGSTVLNDLGYPDKEFDIVAQDSTYQDLRHYLLTNHNQTGVNDSNHIYFRTGTRVIYPRFFIENKEMFFMEAEETNSAVEAEDTEGTSGSTTPDTQLRDNIYDTYLNLNMNAINKVTVKHMVGTPPGGGEPRDYFLVYLNLKEGALLGSKKNPITAQTNGYYEARDFYRSTSLRAGSPDQSITLHWNPLIQTNENGEAVVSFKGPGAKAQLRLEIQGVSSKGNPVATEQTIEVK